MTNWMPDTLSGPGPLYVQLADLIERDIENGNLSEGHKLPPQRNLAFDVGVTVGTVGRAYQLAIERGLLSAEVGRGTFVRPRTLPFLVAEPPDPDMNSASPISARGWETAPHLHRMNSSSATDIGQAKIIAPIIARIMEQEPDKVLDYVRHIEPSWQEAGARWMKVGDWTPNPQSVVPTQGVHAAMMSIIATCTVPGDKIVFEDLTYASLARAITLMGRRVISVQTGEFGLDPDDLESVCAQQHPKMIVTVPTLHNPTTAIMPQENRVRVAEIAQRHNLLIIEDNIYGMQVPDAPTPIAKLVPERTFHVSGMSKSVVAGVRAGWAACPMHYRNRMIIANKSVTGGKSFLLAELAARMVNSGVAAEIANKVRMISVRRERIVAEIFGDSTYRSHPCASYFWLRLEEPWLSGKFKAAAREENILIDEADHFRVMREDRSPHRVRIAVGCLPGEDILRQNLTLLHDIMHSAPVVYNDYS